MSALNKKVLVVDDDPVVGKSFDRVLSQKGYVVVTAGNGQEALSKLEGGEFDMVFTDIRMPGMDGLELAEKVKARHAWTPVVIVTGYGTTANEERAREIGVSAFMHKPLSPEMIESGAMSALRQSAPSVAPPELARTVQSVREEVVGKESILKRVAMLMAAPFIGLAYVVLLPPVGLAMLTWFGLKALANPKTFAFLKNVALFAAAPFIGLVYVTLLPIIGLGSLAWIGVRALAGKPIAE